MGKYRFERIVLYKDNIIGYAIIVGPRNGRYLLDLVNIHRILNNNINDSSSRYHEFLMDYAIKHRILKVQYEHFNPNNLAFIAKIERVPYNHLITKNSSLLTVDKLAKNFNI